MNVDWTSAIEGAAASREPATRAAGAGGFPVVLRSSLAEPAGGEASRIPTQQAAPDASTERSGTKRGAAHDDRAGAKRGGASEDRGDRASSAAVRSQEPGRSRESRETREASGTRARRKPAEDEPDARDAAELAGPPSQTEASTAVRGLGATFAGEAANAPVTDLEAEPEGVAREARAAAADDVPVEGEASEEELDPALARDLAASLRKAGRSTGSGDADRFAVAKPAAREAVDPGTAVRGTTEADDAAVEERALAQSVEAPPERRMPRTPEALRPSEARLVRTETDVEAATERVASTAGEPDEAGTASQAARSALAEAALEERSSLETSEVRDAALARALEGQEVASRSSGATGTTGGLEAAAPLGGPAAPAGAASGLPVEAAPGQPAPSLASEAIAVQTEWLATRGGGTARFLLHPPELGELAIRVTLRGGAVDVVMVAQEATAQHLAEEQSERLAQAFSSRDLKLEGFEVRRGSVDASDPDGAGRFADPEERHSRSDGRSEADSSPGGRGGSARRGLATSSEVVHVPPRILTPSPDRGVDLRI